MLVSVYASVCVCVCYVLGGKEGGTSLLCRPGPTGGKKEKENLVLALWSLHNFFGTAGGCLLSTH